MSAGTYAIPDLLMPIPPRVADDKPGPTRQSLEVGNLFSEALRHHLAGRVAEATRLYERILSRDPGFADAHNNLGVALTSQGRVDDAITRFQRALSLKPDWADAHANLSAALAAKGRMAEALPHSRRALALKPGNAGIHYNFGIVLAALGKLDDAVTHYRLAVTLKPDYADAHNNLANALAARGDHDPAILHYRRAILLAPRHAEACNNLGNLLLDEGKFDDAHAFYSQAIAINPNLAEAHYHRSEIKTFHAGDPELTALEALAARTDLPGTKAVFAHFGLAKALEDTGDYARAFDHLHIGNALKRAQVPYDEPAALLRVQKVAAVFNRNVLDRVQGQGDPSDVPIFVVGMPRSGSTLIEQILASHPQIQGGGELGNLLRVHSFESPRRAGATYIAGLPPLTNGKLRTVDKLPENFLRIGLIRMILPNAKIIHTVRNPIDTCVSCYSKLFTTGQHFTYELGELGRYYREYSALMDHWRSVLPPGAMLEVAYEDVVQDLEGQARRMIDYCGLQWDPACLSFHKTNRLVRTASSVQVRKPLFRSSLERWRRYEPYIGPLLAALTCEPDGREGRS